MQKYGAMLVFLLLLIISLNSQTLPEENPIKLTKIEATKDINETHFEINASVVAVSSYTNEDRDTTDEIERRRGNEPISKGSARFDFEYLKDAEIKVFALKGDRSYNLCTIKTNKKRIEQRPSFDPTNPVALENVEVYYGTCEGQWIPDLMDSCFVIRMEFEDQVIGEYYYKGSALSTNACAGSGGIGTILSDKIGEIITNEARTNSNVLCIPSLILFGLLVAGLYSRGLTLFGIMDILTPKPPKAPDIKYSYANYSPHSTLLDEMKKAKANMERMMLPAALRAFLKAKGRNKRLAYWRRKRKVSVKEILKELADTYGGSVGERARKKLAKGNEEEAFNILSKEASRRGDNEALAVLDMISLYHSYDAVIKSYSERKALPKPLKKVKGLVGAITKPMEKFGIGKPFKMVAHGLTDSFWGIRSNIRAAGMIRLSPLLITKRGRKAIRKARLKLEKKVNEKPADLKGLKKIPHKVKTLGLKTALNIVGGPELAFGKIMNSEKQMSYQGIKLLYGIAREIELSYLSAIIASAANSKEGKDAIKDLLKKRGIGKREINNILRRIERNPTLLLEFLANPVGGDMIVGSENPEIFMENISNVLGSKILEVAEERNKEELIKLRNAIRDINKTTEKLLSLNVKLFSKEATGEIKDASVFMKKAIREEMVKVNDILNELMGSDVWLEAKMFEKGTYVVDMWNKAYSSIVLGEDGSNKLETLSERYVNAQLYVYDTIKRASAANVEFALMRDKNRLMYGKNSPVKGDKFLLMPGVNFDGETHAYLKDSFFLNFLESAATNIELGVGREFSLKDAYITSAIETANFRFGFYRGKHILENLPDGVFGGLGYGKERFRRDVELYSEQYKILFLELAKNKKAEEVIDISKATRVINENIRGRKLSPDEINKRLILDAFYNPEKYGVDKSLIPLFRRELASSIKTVSSEERVGEVFKKYKIKTPQKDLLTTLSVLIDPHKYNKGLKANEVENLRKELIEAIDINKNEFNNTLNEIGKLGVRFNLEDVKRSPREFLAEVYVNPEAYGVDSKKVNDVRLAIEKSIRMTSGLEREVFFATTSEKLNNEFLRLSEPLPLDWNYIKAPFQKGDFGKFREWRYKSFAKKYGFKTEDVRELLDAYTNPEKYIKKKIGKEKAQKMLREQIEGFISIKEGYYEGELYNELLNLGVSETILRNMTPEMLLELYRNPGAEWLGTTITEKNEIRKIRNLIEKSIEIKEVSEKKPFSLVETAEAISRPDYNTTIRKTAMLEFLYNRFNGEVEFTYRDLKKYMATYDSALLNRNGKGTIIDAAEHYHELARMYFMIKAYGLKYFGVDINDENAVRENLEKYSYKEIYEKLKENGFKVYKTDMEDISWFRTKELGLLPYLSYDVVDTNILPEKTQDYLKNYEKNLWGIAASRSDITNKYEYVKNNMKKKIEEISHNFELTGHLLPASAYPENSDFYAVKAGMVRKFLPGPLTESQTEIHELVNKWGREVLHDSASTIRELYEDALRTNNTDTFFEVMKEVVSNTDPFLYSKRRELMIHPLYGGVYIQNFEELANTLGAHSPEEFLNIIGSGRYDKAFLREIAKAIHEDTRFDLVDKKIRKRAKKIIEKIDKNAPLEFEEMAFLIKYDQKEYGGKNRSLAEIILEGILSMRSTDKFRAIELLFENIGLAEQLNGINAYYSKTKTFGGKQAINKFLSSLENRGEYIAAAKYAFEIGEHSKDQSFIRNLKGIMLGSTYQTRQKLNRYGEEYFKNSMKSTKFGRNVVNRFLDRYMKGTLVKNMLTYNGIPFASGVMGVLDSLGGVMSEITWQTYGREILAEERIFHSTEMLKALNQKILKNMITNQAYREFFKKIDKENTRFTLSDVRGLGSLLDAIRRGTNYFKPESIFEVRLNYLSDLIIDGSTITREMGLTYGGIDASKRDGKISAAFHVKSSLGSTEMFAVLGVLGYSAPMNRSVSPFGSGLFTSSMFLPFGALFGGFWGGALPFLLGYTLSGSIPSALGASLYRIGDRGKLFKESETNESIKRLGERVMRFNLMHSTLLLSSSMFYTLFTGPILGLAAFSRHYMFPAASDVKGVGFGELDVKSPKRAYATGIPKTQAAVRELWEKPLIYGAPLLAFLTASNVLGVGLTGGLAAMAAWKAGTTVTKRSHKRIGRRYGLNLTERLAKFLGTTEALQLGSTDEIKYRRAASLLDFSNWYSHDIGTIGAGPVNPGQSYYEFYSGRYRTEPWIHHYVSEDPILKKTFSSIDPSDITRTYDMFSRYNTSPTYKVLQSWRDVYGYGPTESYMWWVMSPVLLSMWLGKRTAEYTTEHAHLWGGAKLMGYSVGKKEKFNLIKQNIVTSFYGMAAPLTLATGSIAPITAPAGITLLGTPMFKAAGRVMDARNRLKLREKEGEKLRVGLKSLLEATKYTSAPNLWRQRCPRCGGYKPIGSSCPACGYNPRKDFTP